MNLDVIIETLHQILRTLFGAGPTGALAIMAMAAIFITACLGLRRGWSDLTSQERSLSELLRWFGDGRRHEEPEISDEDEDLDFVMVQAPSALNRHSTSHAGKVLDLVFKHSRLATPSAEVVSSLARDYTPPGLERQRATQNILLLVGLAGTVFGLAAAIGQVRLDSVDPLSANAAGLAIAAFERVLEELPTAFVSTIWGILLALSYGPIAARLESRANDFVERLVTISIGDWIPKTWPEAAEAQLDDLRRVMRQTQVTVKRAGEMMGEATQDLGGVLQSASGEMGQHVTRLAAVTDESQAVLGRLSTEVTASVGALEAGTNEMRESLRQLRAFQAEVTNAYTQTREVFAIAQSEAKAQIDDALLATRENQAQFSQAIEQVYGRLEGFTGAVESLNSEVREQRVGIDRSLAQVDLSITRAVERILDTSVERLGQTATELREVTEPLRNAVDEMAQLVRSSLAGEEGRESLRAVVHALGELQVASRDLKAALDSSDGALPKLAELASHNNLLLTRLGDISGEIGRLVDYLSRFEVGSRSSAE